MEKYYKNFILCGEADYYCLICQEAFIVNEEIDKHLRWENHRKNIKHHEYVPKFRKDFIYKISNSFYCEICNVVMKSPAEHINEDHHQAVKSSNNVANKPSIIRRASDGAIKINELKLTKHQWHSIIDGLCLLCDETVTNAFAHFSLFNHMVKLIQSETIIYKDNQYYRKLGKEKYYCFTCFKTNNSLEKHTHTKGIAAENKSANTIKLDTRPQANKNNDSSDIMKILMELNSDYFVFDVKNNTATCQKCEEIVKADFDPISKHKALHDSCVYIYKNSGKTRAELKIYGKQNFIRLNEGGSKGCCSLCHVHLSAHINVFKQHVEGTIHRGHLELKGLISDRQHDKPKHRTILMKDFLKSKFGPFKVDEFTLVVINDCICLEQLSLTFIRLVDDFNSLKGKCFVCDVVTDVAKIPEHINTKKHFNLFTASRVLPIKTKGDEELVRQIRPGLYHCGYCNKVFPYWENMQRHLKSFTHEVQRNKKKLLGIIGGKSFLNPLLPLEAIEEYITLRQLDGID